MTDDEYIDSIRLDGEEWKDVVGYEGCYSVSSFGRVVSHSGRHRRAKIMALSVQSSRGRKYACVCLSKDGKGKKERVHRIVATAFLPNPDNLKEIDHINNDGTDNRVSNLKWCDHQENMNNPHTKEKLREYKIANPYLSSLSHLSRLHDSTKKAVVQIKDGIPIAFYNSLAEAERKGYKKVSISAALHGRLKTYKGFRWMFLSDFENEKTS